MALVAAAAGPAPAPPGRDAFLSPPPKFRPRVFWRVFGPAWSRPEIDYQLGLIRDAHFGGVTAFFMCPVEVEGPRVHNQRFLSPEFLETLGYAARGARANGLRFSVAGSTGWPFGGPTVAPGDSAQRIRPLSDGARPGAGETLIETGGGPGFATGPTRMEVKRAAFGAEGLVVSHFDADASRRYVDAVVAPMVRAAGGALESVFCDSLEVYHSNWTPDLPVEFQRRRGHALAPLLPDILSKAALGGSDARFDYWRTLTELTEERFTRTTAEAVHALGVRFEMEAYGTPPNPLTAARYIDTPTGEQYEWKGFSLSRWAASGAHLAGKPLVGAEAWTWLGLPNRLGDSLSDLKLASDLHFLAGVNDLTAVDFAYSPRDAGSPGWLPYYGPAFNQNNPQWPWFHDLADYVARCQWMLRRGKPAAEVAVYLPVEDAFAEGSADQMLLDFEVRDRLSTGPQTGEFGLSDAMRHESMLIHALLMAGFNFDGVDFFAMNRLARADHGRLAAGDGSYSVLFLPPLRRIEIGALERIAEFARAGGLVVALDHPPLQACGGQNRDPQRFHALLVELFGEEPRQFPRYACGRGFGVVAANTSTGIREAVEGLEPEVHMDPPQPDVGFVRRIDGEREIVFLVNTSDKPVMFTILVRPGAGNASWWDPMNGSVKAITLGRSRRIRCEMPARSSRFLVTGDLIAATAPGGANPATTILPGPTGWTLSFHGPDAPPPRQLDALKSWTAFPDAKFFSGEGVYTAEFDWRTPARTQLIIDLGEVRTVAAVRLNGFDAGDAWVPPFQVDLSRFVQPGPNRLEITVANTQVNRFLGMPDQDLRPLRRAYGDRFPAPDEKRVLKEPPWAGLLGPVRLLIGH
jgi:alpha-L-rhamnosidase